ncbi:hypothetical protein N665_1073s0001, partial [Sinapis alba]
MQTIKIEATDHKHNLYRHGHRHGLELECDACNQTYHDGICCRECKFTVHEQCAFLLGIRETSKHPSHDGHCVELLTKGAPDHTDPTCHICADLNVPWHHHPVLMVGFGKAMICNFCRSGYDDGYFCPRCRLMVHESCVFIFDSPEITHPCHVRHPLKLLTDGAPGYTDPECHLCGSNTRSFLYHCKICKFSLDMDCAIRDPLQCLFQVSYTSIVMTTVFLTRILLVLENGHVEFVGKRLIGHVRLILVHVALVMLFIQNGRRVGWLDFDGVPEEIEDIKPFKVNEDGTITHFAHEHKMRLNKDGFTLEESILCGACVRPISCNTFYNCSVCDFVLHE